jgi:hypothetical protein
MWQRIRLKIDPHQHVSRQVFSATLVDRNEFLVLLQIEAQSIQRGEGVEADIDEAVAVFLIMTGAEPAAKLESVMAKLYRAGRPAPSRERRNRSGPPLHSRAAQLVPDQRGCALRAEFGLGWVLETTLLTSVR